MLRRIILLLLVLPTLAFAQIAPPPVAARAWLPAGKLMILVKLAALAIVFIAIVFALAGCAAPDEFLLASPDAATADAPSTDRAADARGQVAGSARRVSHDGRRRSDMGGFRGSDIH